MGQEQAQAPSTFFGQLLGRVRRESTWQTKVTGRRDGGLSGGHYAADRADGAT